MFQSITAVFAPRLCLCGEEVVETESFEFKFLLTLVSDIEYQPATYRDVGCPNMAELPILHRYMDL